MSDLYSVKGGDSYDREEPQDQQRYCNRSPIVSTVTNITTRTGLAMGHTSIAKSIMEGTNSVRG